MFECGYCGRKSEKLLVVGLVVMGELTSEFSFHPKTSRTATQQWFVCPHCGKTVFNSLGELKGWVEQKVKGGVV